MSLIESSEKTCLLDSENDPTEDIDEQQGSKLATWKGIFSTLANENRQRVKFHADSIDEGSDTSSLQSFSSFEQRREWLLHIEANLKKMDYYCENHTTKYYEYPLHLLLCSCVVCFIAFTWTTYGTIPNIWLSAFLYTCSSLLAGISLYYFVKGYYMSTKDNITIVTKFFSRKRCTSTQEETYARNGYEPLSSSTS